MSKTKWIKDLFVNVAGGVVSTILIAFTLAVVAALAVYAQQTKLGLPVAIGAGIAVFAAVVVASNQLQQIDDRAVKRRRSKRTPAQIHQQIWDWLRAHGYSIRDTPNPPGQDFRVDAAYDPKPGVTIYKRSNQSWVVVAATVLFNEEEVAHSPKIAREIQLHLTQLGVQYDMKAEGKKIHAVEVSRLIWFDKATNDLTLLNAILAVHNGMRYTALLLEKSMDEQATSLPLPPSGPNTEGLPSSESAS